LLVPDRYLGLLHEIDFIIRVIDEEKDFDDKELLSRLYFTLGRAKVELKKLLMYQA